MNVPESLLYSEEHMWVKVEGQLATWGMTPFACDDLGEIVFVELPEPGRFCRRGEPCGSLESVKTVIELYAPVSGKVISINHALADQPGALNRSPYGDGWMVVVELGDPSELKTLWTASKYRETYSEDG